jgi:hemerythrin-like domain-containing protein
MNSEIPFRTPQAGFDDPVEMWLACHQRVQRFVVMLGRLENHVTRAGADAEAQSAATSIRRYFNEAAPRHHEDEEADLFPLLRRRAGAPEQVAVDALEGVESEHLAMAQMWRELDATLARIAAGEPAALDPDLVARFTSTYDRHIEVEEQVVLPALRRVFHEADWRAVGRAMAERRGVQPDSEPN